MAGKIGVYFDQQNIGGGLDVPALAVQTGEKWGDLTPVVKVVPVLAAAVDEIRADIEAQGLDGVLLCGASPRVDADIYRLPVQVEHVNLREQCVLAYKNPDKSPVDLSQGAPALLTLMARDYINMGVVKLQKSSVPDSAAITGVQRVLVIGGGWTGLTAAAEAAATGYEVVLVEKSEKLGGAANNIPMASPLASPWTDKQPTNLETRIAEVTGNARITVHCNARMEKLEGQLATLRQRCAPSVWTWARRCWPRAGCPWIRNIWSPWAWAKALRSWTPLPLASNWWLVRSARGVSPLCWT